jgi:uncharacterized membrane protein YjgN (DUF898 family)
MDAIIGTVPQAPAVRHQMRFEGSGGEYFKIWIVNLALSIVTLGIFSAWAKVRSKRYFYGNTYIGAHSFDYHADPIRILIGRAIAVVALISYSLASTFAPVLGVVIAIGFFFAMPWLVNAALRFNARNTSYRNIRFDFTGTYPDAFGVYILWSLLVVVTLGTTNPLARRARVQYNINNHTFGGRYFDAQLPGKDMYFIYLKAWGMATALIFLLFVIATQIAMQEQLSEIRRAVGEKAADGTSPAYMAIILILYIFGFVFLTTYVGTKVLNLALNHTSLSTRYKFDATMSAWRMVGLALGNLFLVVVSLGLYYPWARVRVVQYMTSNIAVTGGADIEGFTSDLVLGQGAIGEEVANFFDVDIGL